jgi:hypothetical protein
MQIRSARLLVGLGLTSGIFAGTLVAPEAARSPYPQPCSVTFLDRVGDKITSDNQGSYKDAALGGDSSISCQVGGVNSDSVKLVLSTPKKGVQRRFWGTYDDPLDAGSPTGSFTDGSYLIIEHVALMPSGTSRQAGAHFRFNGSWFFNWCGLLDGACANFPGSDTVWVTHDSSRHWDVSTDAPGGDVAALQDGATNSYRYHMPFRLSIDCPGCP